MTSEDCDSYIGQQIKDYTLVRKLGGGGSAHVYLAESSDNNYVAIKLLDTKHLHASSTYRQNFFQESHILRRLRHHPYILSILDEGEYERTPYIVTEYAPGGTLRDRFRRSHHIMLNEAFRILVQIGEAIDVVHQCDIAHNDLKPENILFNNEGEALLADFGIAIQLKKKAEWYGSPRGTYAYMAPEQFDGIFTTAGDQYALGCIAYEILTEKHPLEYHVDFNPFKLENMRELHRNAQIPSLRQLNSDIPEHIDQAIMRMLAKRPSTRYASVASFIRSLYPSTSLPPDADFHLAPILNTPPPDLSNFEAFHIDRPFIFAVPIEALEIAHPIKENSVQIPSDARHSSPSIIKNQYNGYTQNTENSFIPLLRPYREVEAKPKRKNSSEVLYDLRLPFEYVNQLELPLRRLGLDIDGGELDDEYHTGPNRICTIVKNNVGLSRSFLYIPDNILSKADAKTISAIRSMSPCFPKGSILALFHNKTPVLEIRRIMQKQWKAEREITVIFVPEQDLRSLAKRDEEAKRYWLTQDLQLQDLIDHQWKPLSVQHMDQNDIHILVQIIMKIPQVIDHSGRGWRLLLNEAGLTVISGEELESQGPAHYIAWNLIMRLKVRARLPEKPECEVLGWLLQHICHLFSTSFEDQREIQRIMQKYTLIPPGWMR